MALDDQIIPFEEARRRLKLSTDVFNALIVSGLLGRASQKGLSARAVHGFNSYGTQWSAEMGERLAPYDNLPNVPEGEQPILSYTQTQLSPLEDFGRAENDTGWIAQFYVKPNRHFFPFPMSLCLVGPSHLRLERVIRVRDSELPAYVCPDPSGELSMVMVIGNPFPVDAAYEKAYDIVVPILDELSFQYDQPLPIAQAFVVGIPSGTISIEFLRPPGLVTIRAEDEILSGCPYPELREAMALYRDGLSDSNPFHQFLAFWKVYESACRVRSDWRKHTKQPSAVIRPEVFPDVFVFRRHSGKTFDQVRQILGPSHRNAIAHSDGKAGAVKTPASSSDYVETSALIPVVSYIAKVTLENVRATLAQDSAQAGTGQATGSSATDAQSV